MCVDFTNLNKACPKDAYPLPCIDKLVDNASGYKALSFMDAYSGYNQILMHPEDQSKTAFITEHGNFCYKVMPFGLKNAGATYQRLMDKVFQQQIGRNMEVYVDDMVAKTPSQGSHCDDLVEIFRQLRAYNMRLNPDKCAFGVQGGKFLGFMLTSRGIEANPEKCRAVLNMASPKTVKEVQQLAGRIAALSRFLPAVANRSYHFFQTFSKGRKFNWTDECWPTIKRDCITKVKACDNCQKHATLSETPAEELHTIEVSWPFDTWGLDILGPFPKAPGQVKFLLVSIDYFSKWIEAQPLAHITSEKVRSFLWKNIICRFGIPREIISDNGRQFTDHKLAAFLTNFNLRTELYNQPNNQQARSVELDLVEEDRDISAIKQRARKQYLEQRHHKRVVHRSFNNGDLVLRRTEDARKPPAHGKLAANWEGPFRVLQNLGKGAYKLETLRGEQFPGTWNVSSLKEYQS
ncbi:uncharacterized protein LOC110266289 [Arachis ipaensis]|uniref:uncharacterized protein LOC110266289 n=1 Tax=Arachis ipaensis TaxID=130454 RepID=UPI000A2B3469|nr:uncharacterized protein LOC110266289 [Arachis ipaensis]